MALAIKRTQQALSFRPRYVAQARWVALFAALFTGVMGAGLCYAVGAHPLAIFFLALALGLACFIRLDVCYSLSPEQFTIHKRIAGRDWVRRMPLSQFKAIEINVGFIPKTPITGLALVLSSACPEGVCGVEGRAK